MFHRPLPASSGLFALLAFLLVVPGAAAGQPIDPATVTGTSAMTRALASFLLIGAVGGGFLAWSPAFVDRAVDDTMDRPSIAGLYGLFAFVLVVFVGGLVFDILGRAGVAGTSLGYLVLALLAVGVLVVGGLGFLVLGTVLTDLFVGRRPRQGLVLGAALSAVGWLALPPTGAVAAWILLSAVGVGGRTRTWVHSERTVRSEVDS